MAQELAVQQSSPSTHWSEPQLGASARSALNAALRERVVGHLPILSPAEIAEIKAAERAYEASLGTSSDELIAKVFGLLATAFPMRQVTEDEADAKLALYCRALGDVPPDALERAVDGLLKSQNWFPTIAEIRQAASPFFEPRRQAMYACRILILRHDRDYRAPIRDKTDWTAAEVDAANHDFRRVGIATRYRLDPARPGHVEVYQLSPDEAEAERNPAGATLAIP
jgi:hypothetical protein